MNTDSRFGMRSVGMGVGSGGGGGEGWSKSIKLTLVVSNYGADLTDTVDLILVRSFFYRPRRDER